MPGGDAFFGQRVRHLDGRQHPQAAIVAPAVDDRIDVRAQGDGRQAGLRALSPADQIARRVNACGQPGLGHPSRHRLQRLLIFGREGDAGDSVFRRPAELGQSLQPAKEAFSVDGHADLRYLLKSSIIARYCALVNRGLWPAMICCAALAPSANRSMAVMAIILAGTIAAAS